MPQTKANITAPSRTIPNPVKNSSICFLKNISMIRCSLFKEDLAGGSERVVRSALRQIE